MNTKNSVERIVLFVALMILLVSTANAENWSKTEAQIRYGNLSVPSFAGGGKKTTILTFQYASEWKYGDNFSFVDIFDSEFKNDIYGEWYSNFSLGKITGKKIEFGPINDVGLLAGINFGADANVLKYLPGVRLSWNVSGFTFVSTDFMYYIDANKGISSGGAPKESDGFKLDISWERSFKIGHTKFSFEGHAEYLSELNNELGEKSNSLILAQPQLRWYVQEKLAVGIEYQFWINKLGDPKIDESAVQLLIVYQF